MGGFGAFADSDNESAKPAADSDDENKMDEDERQENDNEKEKKKSDKKKDKKDKKSSSEIGLSSEQKKEFKKLKAKKEDGSLSKSDKARYKELKSLKKGGDGDNEEVSSPKKGDSSSSKVYGGVSDGKPVWPPPKAEVAPWPPVAATSTSATSEDASKEGEEGGGGEEATKTKATKTKVTKMSKLQMKMEAAKLKREAEAKAKEEEEAMIVQKAKEEAEAKKQALKKNTTTTESGSGSGAAAEEEQGTPSSTTMKQKSEDATKRVFNVEDDLVRDASVPCSASLLDTDIPEIDESKLTKKELKKAQRDRENLIRLKEAEQERVQRSLEGAQFSCSQTAFDERDPVWLNSLDISIPSITISAYNKNLFVDAPLTIAHGRHYGLVGPNGKGKSTLLKMIASGSLKIPPRIDALYVEQEVHADETPAFEAVLMADKVRWALIKEEREILAATAITHDEEKDTRLAAIYEELSAIDAASAEPKARRILFGLGFDSEMQNRPTREFSGGWRMRISLARALFIEPTFLMLDEPTNHLDLNAVIWLDDYLQRWKKTLLIVSHDQDFLNSTCEEILHLNNQKLDTYRGNYDTFKQLEVKKREQANKAWELEQKRIKQLKASGVTKSKANEQVKNKKNKEQGNDKKKKNAAVASGTDTADAKQLLVRSREYTVTLQFGDVQKLAPPVIQVMESTFRYQPHLPIIFDELNFGIDMDSRICVVGNNGSGKSTLIKMLVGEVEPTTGFIRRNPKLRVGIYNQHFVDKLPMASSPVEYLRNSFDDLDYQSGLILKIYYIIFKKFDLYNIPPPTTTVSPSSPLVARNLLGKFGLEGHAHEIAMRDLSGGQKARVTFCELTLSRPHVLFLDEPTNNLDIESIDALCEAINLYQGGMVVVTHDARLIEATESELWVVEDRKVIAWDGEFDSYREHLLKKLEQQMEDIN